MVNLGALNWFDSFIKNLKKALDCINYVIYTPCNVSMDIKHVNEYHSIPSTVKPVF